MELESVLSECMELGVAADLDFLELSNKTPDEILLLSLERILQTKKLEVTQQRHAEQVMELKSELDRARLKIKELEDQLGAKEGEIQSMKSVVQNTEDFQNRSPIKVTEVENIMEDDGDYEIFDWSGFSRLYSDVSANYVSACETAEKSTFTDDYFISSTGNDWRAKFQSQQNIDNLVNAEESASQERISPTHLNELDSDRISNISPTIFQAESTLTDIINTEQQMRATPDNHEMRGESKRTSVSSGSFVCKYCHQALTTKYGLQKHLFGVHFEQSGVYKCEPCMNGYLTQAELMRHKRRTHKTVVPSFPCRHCGKKFSSHVGCWTHEKMHVGTNRQLERAQCTKCDKSYGAIHNLQSHVKKAHSKK